MVLGDIYQSINWTKQFAKTFFMKKLLLKDSCVGYYT